MAISGVFYVLKSQWVVISIIKSAYYINQPVSFTCVKRNLMPWLSVGVPYNLKGTENCLS